MEENKHNKFSPSLCKYFILAELDISRGIYEQHFHTSIGRISQRFGVSRSFRDGYACSSVNSIVPRCNS